MMFITQTGWVKSSYRNRNATQTERQRKEKYAYRDIKMTTSGASHSAKVG